MLQEFHSSSSPVTTSTACPAEGQDSEADEKDKIPVWCGVEEEADSEVKMGEELNEVQR